MRKTSAAAAATAPVARRWISPLRYPGGKARMGAALTTIWETQMSPMDIEIWSEPFAGGAGAGLHLLADNTISELWLTEKHPALAAFWRTAAHNGAELAASVRTTTPSMQLWRHAQEAVAAAEAGDTVDDTELAFAALILNRCSRSGMVNAIVGPMGGKHQSGRWTLQSRWYGEGIAERIDVVHRLGDRIRVMEGDGIEQIRELDGSVGIEDEMMLFVDPPYLVQGNRLYANGMTIDDHARLASALAGSACHWLLTYDGDDRVLDLYPTNRVLAYQIPNTVNRARIAEEYAVLSPALMVADDMHLLPKGGTRWVQHAAAV